VHRLELFHLLLENADVIHEGDHAVGCHWTRVESGCGKERSHVERHGALRGVQDEQFAPAESQQSNLVCHLDQPQQNGRQTIHGGPKQHAPWRIIEKLALKPASEAIDFRVEI